MKSFRTAFFYFFILLFLQKAEAQNYFFKNLTEADGLPDNYTTGFCQDKTGFIWIATHDGLCRYDGNQFEVLRSVPNDSASILSSDISDIFCDSRGWIWCAHTQEGVSCLNPVTGKFRRFPFSNLFSDKHFHGYISAIRQSPDGKIYAPVFGLNHGLYVFDEKKNNFSYFNLADENSSTILDKNNFDLLDIYFKNETTAYLGTWNGLVIYDLKNHKPISVHRLDEKKNYDYDNNLKGFFRDKNGTLWIGTWQQGIAKFEEQTGKLSAYTEVTNPSADRIFASSNPIGMKSDSEIWLTGWGIYSFNINTKKVTVIPPVIGDESSPLLKTLIGMKDRDGNFWFGGISGVSIYSPQNQNFSYVNLANIDFAERNKNNLIGTAQVFCKQDDRYYYFVVHETIAGRTNELFVLNKNKSVLKKIEFAGVSAAVCEDDGTIYFVESDGNGKERLMQLDRNSLTSKFISDLPYAFGTLCLINSNGKLFIGGNGSFVYDIETKRIEATSENEKIKFYQFVVSADGKIFVATSSGIYFFNNSTNKFVLFQKFDLKKRCNGFDYVSGICFDKKNNLWFAVRNYGVGSFNITNEKINLYTELNGIQSLRFQNIFCDEQNKIWIEQGKGFTTIDAKNFLIQSFNLNNGLKEMEHEGSLTQFGNGKLWAAWALGIIDFNNEKISIENNSPVVFTAINIFNKTFQTDSTASSIHQLILQHNQNFFSVKVALLNFINASQNQYRYRLINLDTTWINNGKNNQISFSGLAPGKYELQVKAINADGKVSSKTAILFIEILPAWWQTLWLKIVILITISSVIYFVYRLRVSQIRDKEKLKNEFNQKVAEVEMQALRAQMNPHVIFNCLNSINRYIVRSDKETASEYVSKFSRLIRLVLDNSKNNLVSLDKELEQLELYMEMEQMRFENKFEFVIVVSPNVDSSYIEIPPLLIQPYVENAIWHGLMHRAEKGFLKVKMEMQNENTLVVFVEDNGVGRKRAEELKSKSATHKSHGMQMTNERLNVYNKMYNMNASVEIIDKENEEGTMVKILIPMKK